VNGVHGGCFFVTNNSNNKYLGFVTDVNCLISLRKTLHHEVDKNIAVSVRFEVLMTVKISVLVFWVVKLSVKN
jgi:hypothetical protein